MAINITRVYTRAGDQGDTSLVGRVRISKGSQKLSSYGSIDELNTFVGMARTILISDLGGLPAEKRSEMDALLLRIQNELFDVGSILATPAGKDYEGMPVILPEQITELEKLMDTFQEDLESLPSFTLPGGSFANASLHQCRSVCRRAEREMVRLSKEEELRPNILKYVNRLSDLFFVLSRYVAKLSGVPETLWDTGLGKRKPGKL
ncbi:MAG: cob(I)yrinic acid a,c-diamide adenosyltransferase [Fibrobacteres bacterium]|jgi:cob(I)alamin adenosyltransferase|nr:cob(I)yrinic acid a,c-diamide adenosyltransferase [Fibrobacterota bacterium]